MLMLRDMMKIYQQDGFSAELASARVCQDIVLMAISKGPFNRNVTIKGGVVMRSITNNNRRATRDIDVDFIHYPLSDVGIKIFVEKMNCIRGIEISIVGDIEELKHQDYHGRSVKVQIKDQNGTIINSKIDIGVHKHFELEQDQYCFDICMDENGASLLKNSVEQSFTEKLRSLLIFGPNSRRYKDIFDLYYLKDVVECEKLCKTIQLLIFNDTGMRENDYESIIKRVENTFSDSQYLQRVSLSKQRWVDDDIQTIADEILAWLKNLNNYS